MRYRKLTADGDYLFGSGPNNFYVNSPDCVAQTVMTRLRLQRGEWFLDLSEGTPYATQVLGENTRGFYDQAIQSRIVGTLGVRRLVSYTSVLSSNARNLRIAATIDTIFGAAPINVLL